MRKINRAYDETKISIGEILIIIDLQSNVFFHMYLIVIKF